MAHNINRNNGKDSIVWAGETPWHRLGTKLPEAFTAAEALQHGGLDYTVEKVGLQTVDGAQVPNRYALRRTDTKAVLGVCAGMYQPLQNRDAFSFFDGAFGKDKARYEVAGVLGAGERVEVADCGLEAGAQVWIERVGSGSECTVIIEDGEVKP